ncbi:hypothetical protein OEM_27530 [Mycobacterium intracellulare subsp. yongonense 05-1390]|nr:hypothetical protein OEM_27530 [Mycobacterium intracellulare subsp. yongonense 05-1390]
MSHRGFLIEIGRDLPAGVVIAEWVQADMCFASQVGINDLRVSGR